MANQAIGGEAPFLNPWRVAGWSIPVLLLITPAVAMRYTREVDWGPADFLLMGALFGIIGLGIEYFIRHSRSLPYRLGAVVAIITAFLTIWVNLAVGMIGDNNPYNLLFGAVLMLALIGAILARFRAAGLAKAALATAAAQALVAAGGFAQDARGAMFSGLFALPWLLSAALFARAARNEK